MAYLVAYGVRLGNRALITRYFLAAPFLLLLCSYSVPWLLSLYCTQFNFWSGPSLQTPSMGKEKISYVIHPHLQSYDSTM